MSYKHIKEIKNQLKLLAIPANIKGYEYLIEAINMAIDKPSVLHSITKELYPTVASSFDTTSACVERAIRHAVGHCFNDAPHSYITNIFGNTVDHHKGKATNSHFIATLAEYTKDKTK